MMRASRQAAFIALVMSVISCNEKGVDFFFPGATSPQTGNLTGLVSSGTVPIVGATVSLSQTLSTTTNSSGIYSFLDLSVGQYTITTTASGFTCINPTVSILLNQTVTSNITCTPLPGSVTGTVRVSGTGQSGVAVTLMQGTATIGSATTGAGGTYTIANVPPGAYSASVTPPANTSCTPNPQNVTVATNQAATASFDCTPLAGAIVGIVRFDGVGQGGRVVVASQGISTAGTATTAADGTYRISPLTPGTYSVSVTPPVGGSCTPNPQTVTVQANQDATANFDCTTPQDFAVTLGDPPPSYRHIVAGVSSETCVGISATPAQPGATWTTMWTGTGTVGTNSRTGTFDATNHVVDRQPINLDGTYNLHVTVVSGSVTRTADASVVVTAAAGTCPP